ncbi:TRAP transporter small permease [Histidinibacterium aquaticum]|uniref:TRAP transporter small permease protein n=1 Tax=Histidinibacterium aquaticum TaxID=2613962 RepID=A0A5J5GIJ8_9RHOB|nr:TRAP transporter small permease [Histidinibacterium aquaticum]KAA9007860.1 TRAP transporter small permease [Histidinibacterium aquaticum]
MRALDRVATRIAQGLALIGSLGVLLMLVHVTADVAARNLFGQPIPATNAIVSRYYMVLIAFLPLGWVERNNAMVKVELTEYLTPGRIGQANDILVSLLAALVYLAIAWVTLGTAIESYEVGSFVDVLGNRVAVWPTYFLPPIGFTLAALVCLVRIPAILTGSK